MLPISHAVISDERLHGVVLGQTELVDDGGGVSVSGLGSLPELTVVVRAREQRLVLLRLLFEDAEDLAAFEGRVKEPCLPYESVVKDLKRRGKI